MKKQCILFLLLILGFQAKPQSTTITNSVVPQPTVNPNDCQAMGFDNLPAGSFTSVPGWTLSGGTYTNSSISANCLNYVTSGSIIPTMGIAGTPFAFSSPSVIPASPFIGSQVLSIQPPVSSGGFGIAERSFSVTSANKFLEYAYMFSISRNTENCCEAAYFKITLFDNSGNPIPCSSVTIVGTNQTYTACPHPSAIPTVTNFVLTWTPNWIVNSFDLTPYVGTKVKLKIDVGTCTAGGHYPILWFDTSCSPSITHSVCNNGITTLSTYAVNSCTWNGPPTSTVINNTNASISTSVSGVYSISIYNPNCGSSITQTIQINNCSIPTGVNKLRKEAFLSIFPNPSNGNLFIRSKEKLNLILIDISGSELKKIDLGSENNYQTDISNLPKGIYFIMGEGIREKIIVCGE